MRAIQSLAAFIILGVIQHGVLAGDLPIPDATAQARADEAVKAIFKDEFAKTSAADRDRLAATLLSEGKKTTGDPAGKFALLRQSAELAAAAADLALLDQAIQSLADAYAIKPASMEAEILIKFPLVTTKTTTTKQIAQHYSDLIDRLGGESRNDLIASLAPAGMKAARSAFANDLAARIESADRFSRDFEAKESEFKKAQMTLAADPRNREANLVAGQFLCLWKNDWGNGLPFLAQGSDDAIKAVARRDVETPTNPNDQAAVADGWYDLAAAEKVSCVRAAILARATKWYTAALASDSFKGLERLRSEKRLAEIKQSPIGVGAPSGLKTVDLLASIDPKRDTHFGKWFKEEGSIRCEPIGRDAVLQLPMRLQGSYQLDLTVKRISSNGDKAFYIGLPVGKTSVTLWFDYWIGRCSGLSNIDGHNCEGNTTRMNGQQLPDDRANDVSVNVRLKDADVDIAVKLNGQDFLKWHGPQAALKTEFPWADKPDRPFLGAVLGTFTITKCTVTAAPGDYRSLRP